MEECVQLFFVCKANRVCVCLVFVSLTSDSLETVEVAIKFGTVTASDKIMHHMLLY